MNRSQNINVTQVLLCVQEVWLPSNVAILERGMNLWIRRFLLRSAVKSDFTHGVIKT